MKSKNAETTEVFSPRNALAAAAGIAETEIERLEELGLFAPSGRTTADKIPYYEHAKLEELKHVVSLIELGYEPGDVKKILRKVGAPTGPQQKKRSTKKDFLTIGELAERTGIGPRTLKHWEDKGIIFPDARSEGGFRLYTAGSANLVQLIRDLQLFGYKLEEIKEIADLFRLQREHRKQPDQFTLNETLQTTTRIAEKIETLREHTRLLKEGIRRWEKWLSDREKETQRLAEKAQKDLRASDAPKKKTKPRAAKRGKTAITPEGEPA